MIDSDREDRRSTRWSNDPEPIHLWFSLTYANYLVVPRSVLQSMPQPWQAKFCELLDEMREAFGYLDWPSYHVQALTRPSNLITPYIDCEECEGTGLVGEDECSACDTLGEVEDPEGQRYETAKEVGFRTDPIPHYNRGRTVLAPKQISA